MRQEIADLAGSGEADAKNGRSLKDTCKALSSAFAGITPRRKIPQDVHDGVELFLERHHPVSEQDSQRLQEELQAIYNKSVLKDEGKTSIFLQALDLLRPALRGTARLDYWWTLVLRPTLEATGRRKDETESASRFLLGVLNYDADETKDSDAVQQSSYFLKILLVLYLDRTLLHSDDARGTLVEDEYIARQFEDILVAFGQKKSKVDTA